MTRALNLARPAGKAPLSSLSARLQGVWSGLAGGGARPETLNYALSDTPASGGTNNQSINVGVGILGIPSSDLTLWGFRYLLPFGLSSEVYTITARLWDITEGSTVEVATLLETVTDLPKGNNDWQMFDFATSHALLTGRIYTLMFQMSAGWRYYYGTGTLKAGIPFSMFRSLRAWAGDQPSMMTQAEPPEVGWLDLGYVLT